jgi:hypothetical protein
MRARDCPLGATPPEGLAVWGQKKARTLPAGPWKFWERMPERQFRYASMADFVQVRKAHRWLRILQQKYQPSDFNDIISKKTTSVAHRKKRHLKLYCIAAKTPSATETSP